MSGTTPGRAGTGPRVSGSAGAPTPGAGPHAGPTGGGSSPWNHPDRFGNLGLTMLFTVVVEGLGFPRHLGGWTACEGLKVDFRYDRVRSGGDYEHDHLIPTTIAYPPVTLRRGMQRQSSEEVRKLLAAVADRWAVGAQPDSAAGSAMTVTIELFDVHKSKAIATWVLPRAHVTSWSGPMLSARTNDVAVEALVFEHDGFLRSGSA